MASVAARTSRSRLIHDYVLEPKEGENLYRRANFKVNQEVLRISRVEVGTATKRMKVVVQMGCVWGGMEMSRTEGRG